MANAEDSVNVVLRRLLELLDDVEDDLQTSLSRLSFVDGAAENTRANVKNARAVRRDILRALKKLGADVERMAKAEALDVAAAAVVAAEMGEGFNPDARARIARIVEGQLSDMSGLWPDAADEITRAVNAGITSGADLGKMTRAVSERLQVAAGHAASLVDSAIVGAERAALVEVGEDADADVVYLYLGPDDSKTRDFCEKHKDKAYSKKALDKLGKDPLHAGQPKPVSAFLGGYNCRHTLSPMTIEDANEDGIEVIL
jgi:hypothetical protein